MARAQIVIPQGNIVTPVAVSKPSRIGTGTGNPGVISSELAAAFTGLKIGDLDTGRN